MAGTSPVELVPYWAGWPQAFGVVARRLRGALEAGALRVDHVGSTSVPGLLSKDRLDIQLGVGSLDLDPIAKVGSAGFELVPELWTDHVPPGWFGDPSEWEKRFARGSQDGRPVNLHIRRVGAANWRYALLFRDYLRRHPTAAEAYGRAKQRLAPLCPSTLVYAEAKDPICDLVMAAAEEWAVRSGWSP